MTPGAPVRAGGTPPVRLGGTPGTPPLGPPPLRRGAPPPPPPPPPPPASGWDQVRRPGLPATVGRYHVLGELGRGGMGVVYRARDPDLGREVAIKMILKAAWALDPEELARFSREAQATAKLRHPGIVAVHEAGRHEDRPYLVMDLVDGEALDDCLAAGELGPREAATIVRDVALALQHAHTAGVLHRDVKPSNILIEHKGRRPMLADFGLARDIHGGEGVTVTGQIMGTPAYMAPEQAGGKTSDHGPRTDVYGLGSVLYHCIAGRPPFTGGAAMEMLKRVIFDEPEPPRAVNPRVHADLETIALRCLEKRPDRRYRSAKAVADELQRFLDGEPILARPPSLRERVARRVRRHPARVAALGLAGLLLLGAAAYPLHRVRLARVEQARFVATEARAAVAAFERARAEWEQRAAAPAAAAATGEPAPAPGGLLGLGLDAVAASGRWSARQPGNADARRVAFDAAMAFAEVAAEARQWELAQSALDRAGALGLDAGGVERSRARIADARAEGARQRRLAVQTILARAGAGELAGSIEAYDDALFELAGYRDAQTADLLIAALDPITERLRAGETLDDGARITARLCCEALGRIGRRAGAVEALTRHLEALDDERLALPPAVALCRIGGLDALRPVMVALGRLDHRGELLVRLHPYLSRIETLGPLRGAEASDPNALLSSAMAKAASGDIEGGIEDLDRLIELAPEEGDYYCRRASFRMNVGDLQGAEADIERAIALLPDDPSPLVRRAELRELMGRPEEAIADFSRAAELDPSDGAILAARARVYRDQNRRAEAIADLERAVSIDPRDASAWGALALIRLMGGELAEAIAPASRAIELDPRGLAPWIIRARARASTGDYVGAIHDATRVIELDPTDSSGWRWRAEAYGKTGQPARARDDWTRVLELEPADADAWLKRAFARAQVGDTDGSLEDFQQYMRLAPPEQTAGIAEHWAELQREAAAEKKAREAERRD